MPEVEVGQGEPEGKLIALKCAYCGKKKEVMVSRLLESGTDVYDVAKACGLYPVVSGQIVYVFCTEEHFQHSQQEQKVLKPGSNVREFTCKGNEKNNIIK